MRLLLLSDINSSHTQKWATALANSGIRVGVFSLSQAQSDWFSAVAVSCFAPQNFNNGISSANSINKLGYLGNIKRLKRTITSFKPDIVHAHYATSYGLLGTLSGFDHFLSVYGEAMYLIPTKKFLS